ncbi:MAG TPA: hypothetical protein VF392_09765, partial [Terracidiphilus sp.]
MQSLAVLFRRGGHTAFALAAVAVFALTPIALLAQNDATYSAYAVPAKPAPANKQLASPEIEKRVNALLKQMTLEEKLGQLVQYGDVT